MEERLITAYPRKTFKFSVKAQMRKRLKLLEKVRESDYKQFEWLLERLDLEYKPKPEPENTIMIARKEGLRQLTKVYCDEVRQQKLDEYRNELEAQKLPFMEQKLKNLEFIRNEQAQLNLKQTITQPQIDGVRKQIEQLRTEKESNKVEPMKKKWKMY